jgi:hypothetical protein
LEEYWRRRSRGEMVAKQECVMKRRITQARLTRVTVEEAVESSEKLDRNKCMCVYGEGGNLRRLLHVYREKITEGEERGLYIVCIIQYKHSNIIEREIEAAAINWRGSRAEKRR